MVDAKDSSQHQQCHISSSRHGHRARCRAFGNHPTRPLNYRQQQLLVLLSLAAWSAVVFSSIPTAAAKVRPEDIVVLGSHGSTSARFESPILHGERYKNATENATALSSWEAAVAGLPDCKKGSWQEMASGSWYKDAAGEVWYEPLTCRLRRLTGDAARACLADKTIAFVGGSLARYQYVNFAYFMAHRKHMQRYADDPDKLNLVIEKMWGNFSHYYTQGSQQMTWEDEGGSASEHCHCFRLKFFGGSYEHRLLTIKVKSAEGQPLDATVRVLYNQTFGIRTNVANDTAAAVRWNLGDNPKPADVLVVNLGHWMHHGLQKVLKNYTEASAAYEPIFSAATPEARKKTKFVWRSTTHARNAPNVGMSSMNNWNPIWHRMLNSMARFHSWDFYDGHAVTRAMMRTGLDGNWDNLHFLPFVYDQLNDVLLNGIC